MAALPDPVFAVQKKRGGTPIHPCLVARWRFVPDLFSASPSRTAAGTAIPRARPPQTFPALLVGLEIAVAITRFGHVGHDHRHEAERPVAKIAFCINQ
jgi:hypothetical protein